MTNAIDTIMQKATARVKTAYMQPQHVILELNAPSSHIQFNHESCYATSTKQHIISEIQCSYDQYKLVYHKDFRVTTNPISNAYTYFYILEKGIYVCLLVDQVPAHLMRCRPQQRLWNKIENRYVTNPLNLFESSYKHIIISYKHMTFVTGIKGPTASRICRSVCRL